MSAPTKGLLPVFLTVFIDLLGFGIVIPLLPIYAQDHGASQLSLGLLFASFSLMQLIFAPLWGRLSDRIGRKPVLVGGLIGTAGSYVLFGMADTMTMLFVSRALAGFFGANVATAQAWVADVTAPEDRAQGMGIIGAAFGLGFTFGPLIGGEMVGLGTGAPGFAAAGLSAVAAIVGMIRLHEPPRHRDDSSRAYGLRTISNGLRQPVIGTVLLLYFLGILAFSGFESMFIRFGLERFPETFGLTGAISDATHAQILAAAPIAGRYMFVIGLIAAVIQGGFIRRLVPRFGETRLIVAGPLFLGLSFALLAIAPNWALVIGACALMPFGFGLNNPALQGLLSRAVPADHQGAFLGLNQSLGSLARVVGPVIAGLLFQIGDAGTPFVAGAGILFAATLVAVVYHVKFASHFTRRGESA
ncbi:MFS transporter [bacterium]|nr:MAG: MFS transporter [bacterium]RKZ14657.1 MAG: MFS transporter [bacterium]